MIRAGAEPFFMPGGAQGVLLVHGFTGVSAELWLMGRFLNERGYTVLGVRLAGHATTAEDLAHTTGEDWLDSVRDGYALLSGACRQIAVCGHSMGGLLALLLAAEKRVTSVISMSAPIYIAEEQRIDRLPPREACAGRFVPKARRKLTGVPEAANHTYRRMPLVSLHEMLAILERAKAALPRITVPALILHGRNDRTADAGSALYIRDHIGSAEKTLFWLHRSGHLIPMNEERELVFQQAADFLDATMGQMGKTEQ